MDLANLFSRVLISFMILCSQKKGQWSTAADETIFISQTSVESLTFSQLSGNVKNKPSSNTTEKDPLKGRRIVCLFNNHNYFESGFRPLMIDPDHCTHVNYEFAILDSKTYELLPGEPDVDIQQNFFDDAVALKSLNPELKVMLSLGGWADSTKKYSELVEDPTRVDNFIEKVIPFLKYHGFDGLNVAWEYPNCWRGALGISSKDKQNYAEFLKKVREKFDLEDLLLSISAPSVKREIEAGYDVPTISQAVHFINVMSYDMHGPWDGNTGHHAQFENKPGDPDQFLNMKAALEIWTEAGADKSKLNAGIPTYAKTFTLMDPDHHGIGAPTAGPGRPTDSSKSGGFMCYNEICQLLNFGNWTEEEDKKHGFYAYSGDQWACYDPPMMFVRKAKFIIEHGYGGLLIKDVSCDDHSGKCSGLLNPLMKMAKLEMISKLKKLKQT